MLLLVRLLLVLDKHYKAQMFLQRQVEQLLALQVHLFVKMSAIYLVAQAQQEARLLLALAAHRLLPQLLAR